MEVFFERNIDGSSGRGLANSTNLSLVAVKEDDDDEVAEEEDVVTTRGLMLNEELSTRPNVVLFLVKGLDLPKIPAAIRPEDDEKIGGVSAVRSFRRHRLGVGGLFK